MRRFQTGSAAISRPTSSTTSIALSMSVPYATMTSWLIRAQVRVRLLATLISPFGHRVDDAVEVAQRRPPQAEVLDRAADAGDRDDVALAELVLDEDQRAVEVVADEALGAEADGDADDAEARRRPARCRARTRAGSSAPAMTTTKNRMTLPPSSSSVSIRFWTSIADSSWAVPSVASRSSSALTMPWTTSRAEPQREDADDDDEQDVEAVRPEPGDRARSRAAW